MNADYITIDDIENMGQERQRQQTRLTEQRREERRERRAPAEMRQKQISLLEEQLRMNERVKEERREINERKREARREYRQMVANSPLLTLEEMLRQLSEDVKTIDHTIPWNEEQEWKYRFQHLPERPPGRRITSERGEVNYVLDELVLDVEALDFYDNEMGL